MSLGSMSAVSLTRGVDVIGKVGRIEEGSGGSPPDRKNRYILLESGSLIEVGLFHLLKFCPVFHISAPGGPV